MFIFLVHRYGICNDKHPYYIVMEFCANGALKNYLERYKTTKGKVIDKKRNPPPEFGELKEFCEHIASGINMIKITATVNYFYCQL